MPTRDEYRATGSDSRCIGCVYAEAMFCNHPEEVNSRPMVIFQYEARGEDDPCGPDGLLYEKSFVSELEETLNA